MSTPDPKTVRDFARRAILSSAEDVDYIGIGEQFGDDKNWPTENDAFDAMLEAVEAERQKAIVTVSWPDEQQPADVVTAEQQQDGAVGGKGSERAASLLAFLDLHRERRGHDVIASLAVGDGRTVELTQVQLRAVLAERTALAARVAELEGERDLWRTRAYQVGNMFIGERDPEVVPFLGVPGQEPAATETEEC